MNVKKTLRQIITGLLISAVVLIQPISAFADEYEVSGNGSGSSNEVSISNNSQTNVDQSNQAEVSSKVESSANTGDNSANGNTGGDTGITTGDISQTVSVENNTNASLVNIECCPTGDNSFTISGNGADSTNSIGFTDSNQTNVDIYQNANITNNITGSANTGYNSADNNTGGSTSIETGNIAVNAQIGTRANFAQVNVPSGTGETIKINISGNGAGSINNIFLNLESDTDIDVNNKATIYNFLLWEANTGYNSANGNTGGDVKIKTGNIILDIILWNRANLSIVDVGCCEPEQPSPSPTPTPTPTPPSNGDDEDDDGDDHDDNGDDEDDDGDGNGGSEDDPDDPGAVLGDVFPATGWGYLNLTLTALLTLLNGLLLWANSKTIAKKMRKVKRHIKRDLKKIRVFYRTFVKIAKWKKLLKFSVPV